MLVREVTVTDTHLLAALLGPPALFGVLVALDDWLRIQRRERRALADYLEQHRAGRP